MKKLNNKIVFITGGISGIGKAAALAATKAGAIVVLADQVGKNHRQAIEELTVLGSTCLFVPIEITDINSVKKAIDTTVKKFGRLDIAFNNTGVEGVSTGYKVPQCAWDRLTAPALAGHFLCVRYELQQFLKQQGGVFVNMASVNEHNPVHPLAADSVNRVDELSISKKIAEQYAAQNIRANTIYPYYMEESLQHAAPEMLKSAWIEGKPSRQRCKPEDVAKAFVYLASDDSGCRNGTQIILLGT